MKLLSLPELTRELEKNRLTIDGRHVRNLEHTHLRISISCSRLTAAQCIVLAQSVARFPTNFEYPGGLLWISDWGIGNESTENLAKMYVHALRGRPDAIKSHPGQQFDAPELLYTEAFVAHMMLFRWGAYFVPRSSNHFIELSHHEVVIISCRDEEISQRALKYFAHWNPTVI